MTKALPCWGEELLALLFCKQVNVGADDAMRIVAAVSHLVVSSETNLHIT